MSQEIVLNKKIAKEFLSSPQSVDLNGFSEIDAEAARELLNYGGDLSLFGLISLSDEAAEILSNFEGRLNLPERVAVSELASGFLANYENRQEDKFGLENLVYASDSMNGVVERLRRIAPSDAGVLITGETGTGKKLIARAIHQNSPRKKKPFVVIQCTVTEHLVDSELFGQFKGALPQAISDRRGKFEYADGGTLFFNEVGDLPMSTQTKLLRVLEDREITRVGDNKPIKVNVRVLTATNKDLQKEVAAGRFREDLYYRLNFVTVHLDPLAKRRDDIMPLANHFRKLAARKNKKQANEFSIDLRKWLLGYGWKGNVTQLRDVLDSLVTADVDGILDLDDLPAELRYEKSRSDLAFDNLSTISDEVAQELRYHQGPLCLNGLTELSDTAAEELAKHRGELSLNGLKVLTDKAAESLSKNPFHLSLNGLATLSEQAAEFLSQQQGSITLNGLTILSDKAKKSLKKHGRLETRIDLEVEPFSSQKIDVDELVKLFSLK